MKKFKYIATPLLLCCLVFSGCDKYLDVEPKGRQLLKTTNDFDLWLNANTLTTETTSENLTNNMTDNIDRPANGNPPATTVDLSYVWAPQFSTDVTAVTLWGEHYQRINLFNTVILGIDAAEGGTASQKRSLKAEALLGRAYSYFNLVNEYGKPYNAATAATDLAVPFITTDDISKKTSPRITQAEIYQHIIDDITAGISDLPVDNTNARFRGSQAAAYSVLARVYLYRREYTEAQRYAELALANTRATMIDYTTPAFYPTTANVVSHPDVIYGRASAAFNLPVSAEFKSLFSANDARKSIYYISWNSAVRGTTLYFAAYNYNAFQLTNTGTSVQEMRLIAAECAARNSSLPLSTALEHLNVVRRNRYTGTPVDTRDFSSTDPVAVLNEVLAERRRELPFNGLRWFDMRRLDMENKMQAVTRYNAQNEVIATLEPHSNKYTLQIPNQVVAFNPDIVLNP